MSTASVVGTVTDTSGAVIPGASVTITNTGTSVKQTATTNASGDYVFTLLIPGTYTLDVTSTGFKAFAVPNFTLAAGDRKREDAKLQIGAVTQTVTVQATTPALQTQTATISTLVTSQSVEGLPLNGRNVTHLVQFAMGVNAGSPNDLMSGTRPDDRRPTAEFSANGANDYANDSMVDGFDNNAPIGTTVVRPSIDAIQQVVVQTNTYNAQLTRSAGAAVNIITKSGTNDFHGSVYEFFRNSVLDANPGHSFPAGYTSGGTLLHTSVPPKGAFRQNQYGGSIGGPILKNKTFFFADLEQFRMGKAYPNTDTVPTMCNRGKAACPDGLTQVGDFSDQPDISTYGGSTTNCTPNTTVVALGTCPYVDVANPTPLGLAFFNMYPLPTGPGINNNYTNNITASQNYTTWDARIDQHFNNSNTFFGRYSYNDTTTITPSDFPVVKIDPATGNLSSSGVAVDPGTFGFGHVNNFPGNAYERAQQLAMSWDHVFSPTFLLDLRASYVRWANNSLPPNGGKNVANELGFPCNSVSCINYGPVLPTGLPYVSTTGFAALGDAIFLPIIYYDNTFQYMGDFTLTQGKHELHWGASLIRRSVSFAQGANPRGAFNFTGIYTGAPGADMLEGLSAGGSGFLGFRSVPLDQPDSRDWEWGFYAEDNYRTTNWLTLNLGMRYDIFTAPTERMGRFSNWDPVSGLMVSPSFPGAQQSNASGGVKNNYLDFSPRIGFAASVTHTLVVRGGFGITFCPNCGHQYGIGNLGIQPASPPFSYTTSCSPQNQVGTNVTCPAPFASNQVAEYGPPTSQLTSSSVGQTGGNSMAAGIPRPYLSFDQVLAPASCTVPTDTACKSFAQGGVNPYAGLGGIGGGLPYMATPYIMQFSLEVQKDFAGNVVSVGYVGEMGRHQAFRYSMNAANNPTTIAEAPLAYQAGFPWLRYSSVTPQLNEGSTSYNSLQAAFVRRFKSGLTVNVNYVWSHSLQDGMGNCHPTVGPANLGFGNGPTYVNPCYYDNLSNTASPFVVNKITGGRGDIGNPSIDVPYRLAGTVSYQIPFGQHLTGLEGRIAKGWSVNAAGFWQSGLPFNVANGVGSSVAGSTGLDQVCSGRAAHPTVEEWFNPACFVQPTDGTYGTQTMDQLFGPRSRSVDFSIFKTFSLTEKVSMQFRTEIFNLLNVVNYAPPGGTPGNRAASASIPAFDGTGHGLAQSVPTRLKAGAITSLNPNVPARQIQFAVKFLF